MESIWCDTENLPDRKKLKENIHVQNAVIGAGMAGILTAYMLKKKGQNVIVIEAERIASGQTKNTTAKITSQHNLIYDELIKKAGIRRAEGYAKANEAAISEYEKIVKKENIECHFEKLPSYLYTTQESGKEQLLKEAGAAKSLGIKAHFVNGNEINELPFSVTGAVLFENQAQFHPLEFINGLLKDIENTLSICKCTGILFHKTASGEKLCDGS